MTGNAHKKILVLARQDHTEAMRVAAGLTIFGHSVNLIFTHSPVEESPENIVQAELLELAGIDPYSLVNDHNINKMDDASFVQMILHSDHVINL
jgi:hypothetical protein